MGGADTQLTGPEIKDVATTGPETKGALTRRSILDAAIVRFGRDGYRASSVADIARDAGVGGTVAYAYFPSKEALFLAAVDEDAAGVINEGVSTFLGRPGIGDWRELLMTNLVAAVDRHPLAKRLLAGLEPEVTGRVLDIPALNDLRKVCAERLRSEQTAGTVRSDIDPTAIANGVVTIMLALLMSVVQLGPEATLTYGTDIATVLTAALESPPS